MVYEAGQWWLWWKQFWQSGEGKTLIGVDLKTNGSGGIWSREEHRQDFGANLQSWSEPDSIIGPELASILFYLRQLVIKRKAWIWPWETFQALIRMLLLFNLKHLPGSLHLNASVTNQKEKECTDLKLLCAQCWNINWDTKIIFRLSAGRVVYITSFFFFQP